MAYTTIIFEAIDAWFFDVCSFKIDLISEELSLIYRNSFGGYTINGIRLNRNQIKRIKKLSSPNIFEEFRDEKWKESKKTAYLLDGIHWNVQFTSDNGLPILTMKNYSCNYLPPPALADLVNYAIEIGKPQNKNFRLF
ncbi:MAG: hypothetical protein IJF54_07720 [Clostridia bacterium]|nr:hypothetical protein [Clostridia bacterium]